MAEVLPLHRGGAASDSDAAWLEQLFRDHHAKLCAFVAGYTDSDEVAEDIVQELFLAVWQEPERWAEARNVRVLLFVAARNRALDHLRRRRVRARHAQRTVAESQGGALLPRAADELELAEIRNALDSAIEALPARAREIFRLNRTNGLTYRQIADRLGVSIKTVETQMSRSLKKLRARLAVFLTLLLSIPF